MLAQKLWSFLGSNYLFNDPEMTIEHNTVKSTPPDLQGDVCPVSKHRDVPLSSPKPYLPASCPEPPHRQRYLVRRVEEMELMGHKYEEIVHFALHSACLTTEK